MTHDIKSEEDFIIGLKVGITAAQYRNDNISTADLSALVDTLVKDHDLSEGAREFLKNIVADVVAGFGDDKDLSGWID